MAKEVADARDRKILYWLDVDARMPFSAIAKKLRMSVDAVQYRVARMERLGVIRGYYAVIDPSALGHLNCRFLLSFHRTTPKMEREIVDYFAESGIYWWVCGIDGPHDLGVAFWADDIAEFSRKKSAVLEKFGERVEINQEGIYASIWHYGRAYLLGAHEDACKPVELCRAKKADFDGLDMKILTLIADDGRAPSVEIANKAGVTPATVLARIAAMKEKGIIRRFRPALDLSLLGRYWYKIEFSLADQSARKRLLAYFASHPEIIYGYEVVGAMDVEAELEVESHDDFRRVLEGIKEKFGKDIERTRHWVWNREYKITNYPEMENKREKQ